VPDLTSCPYDSAYWIFIAVGAALVLSMGALALALAASRHARKAAFATMGAAALALVVAAIVPYGLLPSGTHISPEVKRNARAEQERHDADLTPEQRASRDAWVKEAEARSQRECLYLSAEWAAAPLLIGLAALGVAIARARAKSEHQGGGGGREGEAGA
jgi:hypothetical protein